MEKKRKLINDTKRSIGMKRSTEDSDESENIELFTSSCSLYTDVREKMLSPVKMHYKET